jgi:arginine-tRNA-protein transferase
MKIFFKEETADTSRYRYPYYVWATVSVDESLTIPYSAGFLASRLGKGVYYMARSLRVDLSKWVLTSENRRVLRKMDNLHMLNPVKMQRNTFNPELSMMAKHFYRTKTGEKIFSPRVIKRMFDEESFSHYIPFFLNEKTVGYCIVNMSDSLMHYAYPFYNIDIDLKDLGMAMMINAIKFAQSSGLQYVYLGTIYGGGRYKLQFKGLEWWNGSMWLNDISKLKEIL